MVEELGGGGAERKQIWKLDKIETKGDGVHELPGSGRVAGGARNWNGK